MNNIEHSPGSTPAFGTIGHLSSTERGMVDYAELTTEALEAQIQELSLVLAERRSSETDALYPPKGTPITAADAVGKYPILKSIENIRRWGIDSKIAILAEGQRGTGHAALYDEYDVAMMALAKEQRQRRRT